jgi:hypothetical protein
VRTKPVKLPRHCATETKQVAITVSLSGKVPQLAKPPGLVEILMIPGLLLIVLMTIWPVPGLQLSVSVALPDPYAAANEIVRGFVLQVTLGVVRLAEGRIMVVYPTPSADATASPIIM